MMTSSTVVIDSSYLRWSLVNEIKDALISDSIRVARGDRNDLTS